MSSKGKRFLASLFGIRLSEDLPQIQSLVPQRISNEIISGQLPTFNPAAIMLDRNETCHFMNRAALAVKKKEKAYRTHRSEDSFRWTKNFTTHHGRGTIRPMEQTWYEFKEGAIFVTNKRIIFVAPEYGFEKKIKDLTAVIPYSDALALQFGNKTIDIVLPDSYLMMMVLKMLH